MKKVIISAIIALIILTGSTFLYFSNTDHTPISHHWEGYKSWYKASGSLPITGDDTKFLGGKHRGDEGYRVIYINDIGESVNKGAPPYVYPEGTVIVKEQYKNKDSFDSGSKPQLSIMIKRAKGDSPKTGDWGYVTGFRRKIHIGKSSNAEFCGGCHKAANLRKNDYVFINANTHQSK